MWQNDTWQCELSELPMAEIRAQQDWHAQQLAVLRREIFRRLYPKSQEEKTMSVLQYPTEAPTAQVLKLVQLVRSGELVEKRAEAIHAALHVECYLAFVLVGQPPQDGGPVVFRSMEDVAVVPSVEPELDAAIDELALHLPCEEERALFGASPFSRWQFLASLIIKVLPLLFK